MGQAVTVTYSFMTATPSYGPDVTNFQVFNDAMRAAARQALAEWSEVTNVTFVEVPDAGAGGALRFGTESMSDAAGYAYYPSTSELGGEIGSGSGRERVWK